MNLPVKRFLIATVAALTLISGIAVSTSARADNDRRGGWSRDHHDDHDWNKGNWSNSYRPGKVFYSAPRYYSPPQRVVYYSPRPYYNYSSVYYSQNFASPTTYTETYYPDGGYTRTYAVGQSLPRDRYWRPIPNYVRYGLRAPGRGERWVYADRDAVLISEATSRILSGVLLATAIND